jgi:hypothetical protein
VTLSSALGGSLVNGAAVWEGSSGGDAGSIELAVPDIHPGETLTLGGGRRLLVLAVVPTLEEDAAVRAILEVEELS